MGSPEGWVEAGEHIWGSVTLLPCPAWETGPPHLNGNTPPFHINKTAPSTRLGGCRCKAPSVGGGALTTRPKSGSHHPQKLRPVFSACFQRGLLHPQPLRMKPRIHPRTQPRARPERDPRNGRRRPDPSRRVVPSSLGAPGGASLGSGVGRSIPPRASPSGTFRPPSSESRRPSGPRTGPLGSSGGGGGAAGGSIPASGRNARSGTVTCRRAALRDPGRLRGHGPRLGALRLVRQVQLHGRAHGPAAGQTGCRRLRPEQRAQPLNNNRRWLEVGGRGPSLGSRGRDLGRG